MLVYMKNSERVTINNSKNVVVLDIADTSDEVNGIVVMSREMYDQALIVDYTYDGDYELVGDILSARSDITSVINFFYQNTPKPLNILAPFLSFTDSNVALEEDIELLCGVLHTMSTVINFKAILTVPKEVRAEVRFKRSSINQYKEEWAALSNLWSTPSGIQAVPLPIAVTLDDDYDDTDDIDDDDDDIISVDAEAFYAEIDRQMAEQEALRKEEEKEAAAKVEAESGPGATKPLSNDDEKDAVIAMMKKFGGGV